MAKHALERTHFTPPELAEMWGVGADKILDLIHSGELVAVNLSLRQLSRPRWRIAKSEAERFLQSRQKQPPAPSVTRRKQLSSVRKFY